MAGRSGRKSGLSVLWIPNKKHGHKKEKYYRPQADKSSGRGTSGTGGSGMFPSGSPYSRRKHQPEPEWPIASGSAAAASGAAVAPPTTTTAVTAASTSAALETAVVVEQQRANGTAPPHTASEPPAAEGGALALIGDAMNVKSDKESSNLRNQEEVIEMADDQTNQAVLGSLADCDAFMNNSNNNKSNGHLDRVDSAIVRKKKKKRKNKKKNNSEKEDECGIRCLSYALQCCECVIS